MNEDLYRHIPAIDRLLESSGGAELLRNYPRKLIVESLRETAARWRKLVKRGEATQRDLTEKRFLEEAKGLAQKKVEGEFRSVINGTGVILNTNLGRAPLVEAAHYRLAGAVRGYSNLELDLARGERGERHVHVERLLRRLTGTRSAMVVNNNAAAVLLILDTFAKRKEVIVSRGELIEIGGSFRLPNVLKKSGARLVEVGTTNRTYVSDYERAITEKTAILLKSHTSNYRVIGFVHRPDAAALARLARKRKIMCVEDQGSGLLVDLSAHGLDEPTVQQGVRAGMDIVTFSGDKLLGGPQCGIILGKAKYVKELRSNPLMRALRVDKMTLSALSAVLRVYTYSDDPLKEIPHLRMISEPESAVRTRARKALKGVGSRAGYEVSIVRSSAAVGGGSCPGLVIPSWSLRINSDRQSPGRLARVLREGSPPVIGTVSEDGLNIDMKTVLPGETVPLTRALNTAMT